MTWSIYQSFTIIHTVLLNLRVVQLFTVSLIVEGDQLDSMQPEDERIGIGRVDACGRWVCAEQLAAGVLDELLGVATT